MKKITDRQQHATAFTLERRERLLALLTVGQTVEQAAATVGISRTTIARWLARGRAPGAATEHERFARRFDEIRSGEAEDAASGHEPDTADAKLDALDAQDPFCALPGDPLGDAWRERQARRRDA